MNRYGEKSPQYRIAFGRQKVFYVLPVKRIPARGELLRKIDATKTIKAIRQELILPPHPEARLADRRLS
ncbi:MAG: hypothetical protein WB930_16080 [Syntrophobacteraceae bacterium]